MNRIFKFIVEETIKVIPAIIFFAISFNLINFTQRLMHKPSTSAGSSYLTATIGALIVGKFILIVNQLPFINAFPKKPLLYNIVWKFTIYGSFALLFRIAEKFLDLVFKYDRPHIACLFCILRTLYRHPLFGRYKCGC